MDGEKIHNRGTLERSRERERDIDNFYVIKLKYNIFVHTIFYEHQMIFQKYAHSRSLTVFGPSNIVVMTGIINYFST